MKKKTTERAPVLDQDGYEHEPSEINGSPLPDWNSLSRRPKLTLDEAQASSRGGRRAGAGRKPTGKIRKQVKLSPATVHRLTSYAKHRKLNFSEALEHIVTNSSMA